MRLFLQTLTVFVASLFVSGAVAAPNGNGCAAGTSWADKTDCHAWFVCSPSGVIRYYCAPGTAWHDGKKTCVTQAEVCH